MKKLEISMINAVNGRRNFKNTNTEVINLTDGSVFVKLYDTIIFAEIDGKKYYNDGGYNTVTTGSRLRALGADYSTNYNKNKCVLTRNLQNIYYQHLFNF